MSGQKSNNDGTGILMFVGILILAIYAMPFVGLWMVLSKNSDKQGLGVVLIVIGVILWIIMAMNK